MITSYLENMTISELHHYKKRLLELLDQVKTTLNHKEVCESDKN